MGFDPEILAIGTEMAAYHIEAGARQFADYASHMITDLGDAIRPYLKSLYNGARDLPEVQETSLANEMTSYSEVGASGNTEIIRNAFAASVNKKPRLLSAATFLSLGSLAFHHSVVMNDTHGNQRKYMAIERGVLQVFCKYASQCANGHVDERVNQLGVAYTHTLIGDFFHHRIKWLHNKCRANRVRGQLNV